MYQQITLIGNLGRDPEMRYTGSGVPVTSFSVAVSRKWTGKDGQQQEKTVWFRVTAWRNLAETCSKYLVKGSKVLVVGEVEEPNAYTTKSGEPAASLEVTAQTVKFLSTKAEDSASGKGEPAYTGSVADEDEIPF